MKRLSSALSVGSAMSNVFNSPTTLRRPDTGYTKVRNPTERQC